MLHTVDQGEAAETGLGELMLYTVYEGKWVRVRVNKKRIVVRIEGLPETFVFRADTVIVSGRKVRR